MGRSAKIARGAEFGRKTLPLIDTDNTDLKGK